MVTEDSVYATLRQVQDPELLVNIVVIILNYVFSKLFIFKKK